MLKRGKLWGLALLPLIGGLAALAGAHRLLDGADDRAQAAAELRIEIGTLRSQIADARLLGEVASGGRLPAVFIRQQAAQLGRHVEESVDALQRRRDTSADRAADAGSNGLADLKRLMASASPNQAGDAGARLERSLNVLRGLENSMAPGP